MEFELSRTPIDEDRKKVCPKCGSKCNIIDFTPEILYIFCIECPFQIWESKYKIRNGLIHEIKELYKNEK